MVPHRFGSRAGLVGGDGVDNSFVLPNGLGRESRVVPNPVQQGMGMQASQGSPDELVPRRFGDGVVEERVGVEERPVTLEMCIRDSFEPTPP